MKGVTVSDKYLGKLRYSADKAKQAKGSKYPADYHWDAYLKGFGVRVYPSGLIAYCVAYRNSSGAYKVKGILKAELKRKGIGYKELSEKLGEMGVELTERSINSKISRGGFSAVFFVQCLSAIGCHTVRLDDA